jgi:hypothetical protein
VFAEVLNSFLDQRASHFFVILLLCFAKQTFTKKHLVVAGKEKRRHLLLEDVQSFLNQLRSCHSLFVAVTNNILQDRLNKTVAVCSDELLERKLAHGTLLLLGQLRDNSFQNRKMITDELHELKYVKAPLQEVLQLIESDLFRSR